MEMTSLHNAKGKPLCSIYSNQCQSKSLVHEDCHFHSPCVYYCIPQLKEKHCFFLMIFQSQKLNGG
uniref:Uncharacterized protein n=1 Tax=Rhizophora mucronata TaxID=61149 RepID=A0A2P2KKN4_RHIMU